MGEHDCSSYWPSFGLLPLQACGWHPGQPLPGLVLSRICGLFCGSRGLGHGLPKNVVCVAEILKAGLCICFPWPFHGLGSFKAQFKHHHFMKVFQILLFLLYVHKAFCWYLSRHISQFTL